MKSKIPTPVVAALIAVGVVAIGFVAFKSFAGEPQSDSGGKPYTIGTQPDVPADGGPNIPDGYSIAGGSGN